MGLTLLAIAVLGSLTSLRITKAPPAGSHAPFCDRARRTGRNFRRRLHGYFQHQLRRASPSRSEPGSGRSPTAAAVPASRQTAFLTRSIFAVPASLLIPLAHLRCLLFTSLARVFGRANQRSLSPAANIILSPGPGISLAKARMLSPDGRCRVFDKNANGFGRGEGRAWLS